MRHDVHLCERELLAMPPPPQPSPLELEPPPLAGERADDPGASEAVRFAGCRLADEIEQLELLGVTR